MHWISQIFIQAHCQNFTETLLGGHKESLVLEWNIVHVPQSSVQHGWVQSECWKQVLAKRVWFGVKKEQKSVLDQIKVELSAMTGFVQGEAPVKVSKNGIDGDVPHDLRLRESLSYLTNHSDQ